MTSGILTTDVLIIGSGGAGIRAALESSKFGTLSVMILSKTLPKRSGCTLMAEGGYNAVLRNVDPEDSQEIHFQDTLKGGAYLNNEKLVEILVQNAPKRVLELEEYGAVFHRTSKGTIAQRLFGHQTYRRTCFAGDRTGHEIMATLVEQLRNSTISIIEGYAIDLLINENRIAGVLAWDMKDGELFIIRTKALVLATGGGSRIYKITTNSIQSTGDGIAMAFRSGLELIDMEMVQFHPTGMVFPECAVGLLVTEAVRGEGGILLNNKGERFMKKYAPKQMELAGRDVVARANYTEIKAGRGSPHGGVYLSIKHIPAHIIEERLPTMVEQFREFANVDITQEDMEVSPTAHHFMGGIMINENCETNIRGVFAAGEVTGGIHGGNRLGGNALADTQVFGYIAGKAAARFALKHTLVDIKIEKAFNHGFKIIDNYLNSSEGTRPIKIREELRSIMWNYVGIIRNKQRLEYAIKKIEQLSNERIYLENKGSYFNIELKDAIELRNMLLIGRLIAESAILRKESRGAHFREDFPNPTAKPPMNIVISKKGIRFKAHVRR
jgi:fumarate reductase (CoM/CoB) subunit A